MKKQRIAAGLQGPAADIVRFLRVSNPNAMAVDYLKALESALGTTENADDLLVIFRSTFQEENEKLSAYLFRLDKLLHSMYRKGGVVRDDIDRVRIEQVVRGASSHDLVALRIKMIYKLKPPPSFTQLLKEVREEELLTERLAAKNRVTTAVTTAVENIVTWKPQVEGNTALLAESSHTDEGQIIESLCKEVRELRGEMSRLMSATVATSVKAQSPPCQVQSISDEAVPVHAKNRNRTPAKGDAVFCYKCGEDGHFQRECQNPENLRKHLEIWGLSAAQYPYDGYLCVRLEFAQDVVGVTVAVETLVLVCPDPAVKADVSLLVGTNMSVVRKLFESCKLKGGEDFLSTMSVHPVFKESYVRLQEIHEKVDDLKRGTVWLSHVNPKTLSPGQTCTVTGVPKFPGRPSTSAIPIDRPEEGYTIEGLLVVPEVKKPGSLHNRRVKVTVRNVSTREVTLKRGMAIAHLFPVDVVSSVCSESTDKESRELTSFLFKFGDSPISNECKERLCAKMMERKEVFSCSEFDVGCAKSAEHTIRVTNNQPFWERSRRIARRDVEDVREHLNSCRA
ncbi:hypothetical protein SRHO_G00034060 [Serrasalmus rhombeus]